MGAARKLVEQVKPGEWVEVRVEDDWVWAHVDYTSDSSRSPGSVKMVSLGTDVGRVELETGTEVIASDSDPSSIPNRFDVPGWDEYFLGIAKAVAQRAKCRRRQVGSVLVDEEHRIVSTGYAGFPAGTPGDCLTGSCPRSLTARGEIPPNSPYDEPSSAGYCPSIHAELNAIIYARKETQGTTVYITDAPCPNCTKHLASAGVVRAVWPDGELSPIEMYSTL